MKLEIDSSRRLMGGNLYSPRAGVVLDVEIEGIAREHVAAQWQAEAQALIAGLRWDATPVARLNVGGASLFFEAPLEVLLRATEVNEIAWQRVCDRLTGIEPEPVDGALNIMALLLEADQKPALTSLARACRDRGTSFMWDDDSVTVGSGGGSLTWPQKTLPDPAEIDWSSCHDIPFAMVTGTNGKSTTVRLLASIMSASGNVVGLNCTDWIKVDGVIVDEGDYAGPAGARGVLRDHRVELAAIEVARGGLLRRGVALESAPVVAVLNVAEDHLGEYGIDDVEALADAKFALLRALRAGGTLVANADDARVAQRAQAAGVKVCWFSLDPGNPLIVSARQRGQSCWFLQNGCLTHSDGEKDTAVVSAKALPVTMDGLATYNVSNCLAAAAMAHELGLTHATIAAGLQAFKAGNEDNPGRGNLYCSNGARMLVDFAHNVHGIQAVAQTVRGFPARRRLLLFGQAGHRTERELADITDAALTLKPDRILLTDCPKYLRGRAAMEVPGIMRQICIARGIPAENISLYPSPLVGVQAAVEWAAEDDACLLLALGDRDEIAEYLRARSSTKPAAAHTHHQENCA